MLKEAVTILSDANISVWRYLPPLILILDRVLLDHQIKHHLGYRFKLTESLTLRQMVSWPDDTNRCFPSIRLEDIDKRLTLFRYDSNHFFHSRRFQSRLVQYGWEDRLKINNAAIFEEVTVGKFIHDPEKRYQKHCCFGSDYQYYDQSSKIVNHEDSLSSTVATIGGVLFLVHGLHGSSSDLALLASKMSFYCPSMIIHACKSIETNEKSDSLEVVALKLADEINLFMTSYTEAYPNSEIKISFLGFSLGRVFINTRWCDNQSRTRQSSSFMEILPLLLQCMLTASWGWIDRESTFQYGVLDASQVQQ